MQTTASLQDEAISQVKDTIGRLLRTLSRKTQPEELRNAANSMAQHVEAWKPGNELTNPPAVDGPIGSSYASIQPKKGN